jgi:hypothetical protein
MGDNVVLNRRSENGKKLNGQSNPAGRRLECDTSNQQVVHLLISEELGISKATGEILLLYRNIEIENWIALSNC